MRSSELDGVVSGFDLLGPFTGVRIGSVDLVGQPPAVFELVLHHFARLAMLGAAVASSLNEKSIELNSKLSCRAHVSALRTVQETGTPLRDDVSPVSPVSFHVVRIHTKRIGDR